MPSPVLLELFSGTGSIGAVFRKAGWQVVSVDIDPRASPTIVADVRELRREQLPEHVDLLWASPPCTHYSRARTKARTPRDLEGSDELVRKTFELADELGCAYIVENPQTGLLKDREVVRDRHYTDVTWCRYAEDGYPPYRKPTRLWHNCAWWFPRPLCRHGDRCRWYANGRHPATAQRGPQSGKPGHSLTQLYSVPPALARDLETDWRGYFAAPESTDP